MERAGTRSWTRSRDVRIPSSKRKIIPVKFIRMSIAYLTWKVEEVGEKWIGIRRRMDCQKHNVQRIVRIHKHIFSFLQHTSENVDPLIVLSSGTCCCVILNTRNGEWRSLWPLPREDIKNINGTPRSRGWLDIAGASNQENAWYKGGRAEGGDQS